MKKVVFTSFAVLLALAIFSCNDFAVPDNNLVYIDGKPFVNLTIGSGSSSRALTDTLAKSGVDFYEVAFFHEESGEYYRTSWSKGRNGRLLLPPGEYFGSESAILFAGNRRDLTLLAVGLITGVGINSTTVTPVSNAQATIEFNTRYIEFTIAPFLTDIYPRAGGKAPGEISFQIKDLGTYVGSDWKATGDIALANFPFYCKGEVDKPVPLFMLPKGTNDIEAEFTFEIPGAFDFSDYSEGILISNTPKIDYGVVLGGDLRTYQPADIAFDDLDPDDNFPDDGILKFIIKTEDENSLTKFTFEIPVVAIDRAESENKIAPNTWFIKGGLENPILDEGGGDINALGGAILLGVGLVEYIIIEAK